MVERQIPRDSSTLGQQEARGPGCPNATGLTGFLSGTFLTETGAPFRERPYYECDGAEDGIRTRDPLLGKEMLYH